MSFQAKEKSVCHLRLKRRVCLSSQAKEKSVFGQQFFRLKRGVCLSFQAKERNVSFQAKEKIEFVIPD